MPRHGIPHWCHTRSGGQGIAGNESDIGVQDERGRPSCRCLQNRSPVVKATSCISSVKRCKVDQTAVLYGAYRVEEGRGPNDKEAKTLLWTWRARDYRTSGSEHRQPYAPR